MGDKAGGGIVIIVDKPKKEDLKALAEMIKNQDELKNGIRFIRGKCTVCNSDCWKSFKE